MLRKSEPAGNWTRDLLLVVSPTPCRSATTQHSRDSVTRLFWNKLATNMQYKSYYNVQYVNSNH